MSKTTAKHHRKTLMDTPTRSKSFQDALILKNIPVELIESLIDNPFESLLLVDADGIVRFVNKSYEQNYSRSRENSIGRLITELAPESMLPEVLKTGRVIISQSKILEDSQIVVRFPLRKDGKLIGALAKVIFAPPKSLQDFARKISLLEKDLEAYKKDFRRKYSSLYTFDDIIGESCALLRAKELAKQCAQSEAPVLILGESGSGKELFAHAIHSASERWKHPFISINCSTIPNELIESELFGYEGGSFTGSLNKGRSGKFEMANKGSIHLDEIGDMPYQMQSKLLRVLQEGEIEKIGQRKPQHVDFRLICTTNRPLEHMVDKGVFRLDLFYRINVIIIPVPPLREIREDIPVMVNHFLEKLQREINPPVETVSEQVMNIFKQYQWPGNVRELKNVLERAIVVCQGNSIQIDDLPPGMVRCSKANSKGGYKTVNRLRDVLDEAERQALIDALKQAQNNKSAAAKLLGIHRTALYQKLSKHNIPI